MSAVDWCFVAFNRTKQGCGNPLKMHSFAALINGMTKVIGIGNALVDIMTSLDDDALLLQLNLPKGSMQLVDLDTSNQVLASSTHLKKILTAGGSASNTIYGLAKLGIETAFVGKVGSDKYGKAYTEDLRSNKIFPKLLISTTHSGRAVALISPDSERTFATHLGAAVEFAAEDILDDHFTGYSFLHIEGYLVQNYPLVKRAVELARKMGMKVSIDLASYNVVAEHLDFLQETLKGNTDIIFANEEEAKSFTGKEPEEALQILASYADIAVVKTGPRGSLVMKGSEFYRISPVSAKSIDTTGAGDLYASGFLYGILKGYPLNICGSIGSLLAGNIIEVIGARMDERRWTNIHAAIHDMTKHL